VLPHHNLHSATHPGVTKGGCLPYQARWHNLQDSLGMWQSLPWWNWGRKDHGAISQEKLNLVISHACTNSKTSSISVHTHKFDLYPLWNEVRFIDQDPHWYTIWVKRSIHSFKRPNPNRVVFTWVSKSNWFCILLWHNFGWKNLHHFFIQSEVNHNQYYCNLVARFFWGQLHILTSSFDWFVRLFMSFVIG